MSSVIAKTKTRRSSIERYTMEGLTGKEARLAEALRRADVKFRVREPLARYTTMRVGGAAEVMVFPSSREQMSEAMKWASELSLPVRLLGAGSNLLVPDEGVAGVVLYTGAMKVVRFHEGGLIEAEAGVNFPALVRTAAARGLRGLEAGVGIPGSLGGVVAMNAGAYDFSIGRRVQRVSVVMPSGQSRTLERREIDFRYRASSLGVDLAIAGSVLSLDEDDPRAVREDVDRHMAQRKATQPVGVRSAGCIFKNPAGDSAGRIIDQLGLKGLRVGTAVVSEVHGNFIVSDPGGTAAAVFALIEQVKERVHRATSIALEEEVKRWT